MVLQLDGDKLLILDLVKMRMTKIAPNLSEAVGEEIAARLMGVAGSLENLSKMPACNVQVSSQSLWHTIHLLLLDWKVYIANHPSANEKACLSCDKRQRCQCGLHFPE